jgi:hypothetical protein
MNVRIFIFLFLLLVVRAVSATEASTEEYAMTFRYCRDIDSYQVTPPELGKQESQQESANNDFSPLPDALLRLLKIKGNVLSPTTIKQMGLAIAVLRPPAHGRVRFVDPPDQQHKTHMPDGKTVPLPIGTTSHHYTFMPDLGYLGRDYVAYEVLAYGKRYKVVVNFLVVPVVNENEPATCMSEKFNN